MKKGQVSFPPQNLLRRHKKIVPVCAGLCRLCRFVSVCGGLCRSPIFCKLTEQIARPLFLTVENNRGQNRGRQVSKAPLPPKKNCFWFLPLEQEDVNVAFAMLRHKCLDGLMQGMVGSGHSFTITSASATPTTTPWDWDAPGGTSQQRGGESRAEWTSPPEPEPGE